jgi:Ca2+-binding RTX toxin-like protein
MRLWIAIASAVAALALAGGSGAAVCPASRTTGTEGADRIEGTAAGETIDALGGDDVVNGNRGPDCIFGGDGSDHLEGGFGEDTIRGGRGDDLIGGGQERSSIAGGPGSDRISSSNGVADAVDCGSGADRVLADRSDRLTGCERVRFAVSPYPLVTPRRGGSETTFTVYFRALYPAGGGRGRYVIGAVHSGECRTGYSSFGRVSKGRIERGEIVRFRLPPGPHGGWCPGVFHGVGHWERGSEDIRLGRFAFRVR